MLNSEFPILIGGAAEGRVVFSDENSALRIERWSDALVITQPFQNFYG